MNCPECFKDDLVMRDILASEDRLSMEFECNEFDGWLEAWYWCRRCDHVIKRRFDPELLLRNKLQEEE